jgi:hypothetical protein
VIVRQDANVDASGCEATDVRWMHSIVDALATPEFLVRSDARLEIDDPSVRSDAFQFVERIAPDVSGRNRTLDGTAGLFGQRNVIARVAYVWFVNLRRT